MPLITNFDKNFELYNNTNFKKLDIENIESLYQYSIPNVKLYYPEPYIASPSFIHNDIWYMHILVYWYWLWFVFLFLIVFFFITFLCCIRWCNPRIQPRRETRGVSRSKCGDLITATIPVTWAISIIISESTDSMDYYDGFKTTELIIGVRAYQWGWEYYYPKDIDTNYNLKKSYSEFLGNSIKYNNGSEFKNSSNKILQFLKKSDSISSYDLSSSLLLPNSGKPFNNQVVGKTSLDLDSSFKSISKYTKNSNNWINETSTNMGIKSLFNNELSKNWAFKSIDFKIIKQYNLVSSMAYLNNFNHILDLKNINKLNNKTNFNRSVFNLESCLDNSNYINYIISPNSYSFIKNINNLVSDKILLKNINLLLLKENKNLIRSNNSLNLDKNFLFSLNYNSIRTINNNFFQTNSKLNTFEKDFYFNDTNVLKKKFNNFLLNEEVSPFSIKFGNNKLNYINKINNKSLVPIISDNLFASKYNLNYNYSKKSLISNYPYNETTNPHKSSFWSTNFFVKNNFYFYTSIIFKNKILNKSFLNNFFVYNDYDFLNKDFFKILEVTNWNSIYNDFDLDLNQEYSNANFFKFSNNDLVNFNNNLTFSSLKKVKSSSLINNYINLPNQIKLNYLNYDFYKKQNSLPLVNLEALYTKSLITKDVEGSYELFKANYVYFNLFNKNLAFYNKSFIKNFSFLYHINSYKIVYNHQFFTNNFFNYNYFGNNFYKSLSTKSTNTNLRNSSSELISDYKSLQKVFKLRFDDFRSNSSVSDLSSSFVKQLDLTKSAPKFDSILTKNKSTYFSINTFRTLPLAISNNLSNNKSILNNYSFDFPFLIALQSDQSRYIWFDWFSRWSKYEVQQPSLAKLGIYGLPKFDKSFEYGSNNSNYIDSENYLSRLMVSRKNYKIINRFSPSLLNLNSAKSFSLNQFNKDNNFFYLLTFVNFESIFTNKFFYNYSNFGLNNLTSGLNFRSKNFFKSFSINSLNSNNYSQLADILTKREFLYKNLLLSNNIFINLPNSLSSHINSQLIRDLGSVQNENIAYFNNELKNQYKPIKRGISNMIRIQASNIIALPVELRIQVLASSRDIIHSWAVPSAGIKMDCIPGYSSHKILFFLLSGIYWGQCMEICGRYHHWMPIIVYFMKRDLFFLWCSHFVLNNKNSYVNNYLDSNQFYKNKPIKYSL